MFIKVCGVTRVTDALHAVEQGATAIGFVMWRHSPRAVTPERAAEIIAELPSHVVKVGVSVADIDQACEAWSEETSLLLDNIDPERRGGTGAVIDWSQAAAAAVKRR